MVALHRGHNELVPALRELTESLALHLPQIKRIGIADPVFKMQIIRSRGRELAGNREVADVPIVAIYLIELGSVNLWTAQT